MDHTTASHLHTRTLLLQTNRLPLIQRAEQIGRLSLPEIRGLMNRAARSGYLDVLQWCSVQTSMRPYLIALREGREEVVQWCLENDLEDRALEGAVIQLARTDEIAHLRTLFRLTQYSATFQSICQEHLTPDQYQLLTRAATKRAY